MKQDCDKVERYGLKCKILSARFLQYLQYFTGRASEPKKLSKEASVRKSFTGNCALKSDRKICAKICPRGVQSFDRGTSA